MQTPNCSRCGEPVRQFEGNLTVDRDAYLNQPDRILWLRPYCLACIRYLDEYENGRKRFHHLWGVDDVVEEPLTYLGELLRDIAEGGEAPERATIWEPEAIRNLIDLVVMSLPPNLGRSLLEGFSEWDLDSPQANCLSDQFASQGA
jgi:hypothetical protein